MSVQATIPSGVLKEGEKVLWTGKPGRENILNPKNIRQKYAMIIAIPIILTSVTLFLYFNGMENAVAFYTDILSAMTKQLKELVASDFENFPDLTSYLIPFIPLIFFLIFTFYVITHFIAKQAKTLYIITNSRIIYFNQKAGKISVEMDIDKLDYFTLEDFRGDIATLYFVDHEKVEEDEGTYTISKRPCLYQIPDALAVCNLIFEIKKNTTNKSTNSENHMLLENEKVQWKETNHPGTSSLLLKQYWVILLSPLILVYSLLFSMLFFLILLAPLIFVDRSSINLPPYVWYGMYFAILSAVLVFLLERRAHIFLKKNQVECILTDRRVIIIRSGLYKIIEIIEGSKLISANTYENRNDTGTLSMKFSITNPIRKEINITNLPNLSGARQVLHGKHIFEQRTSAW